MAGLVLLIRLKEHAPALTQRPVDEIALANAAASPQHDKLRRLLTRTFSPEPLLRQLADPGPGVPGLHFYTFNELERTERWRRETLARLGAAV